MNFPLHNCALLSPGIYYPEYEELVLPLPVPGLPGMCPLPVEDDPDMQDYSDVIVIKDHENVR